jgi:uncharacterized protein YbcI
MTSLYEAPKRGEIDAAISNAVVGLIREHVGRGPTKARTIHSGKFVLCVLEDTMTKAERTLASAGEEDSVLRMRHSLQQVMGNEMSAAVETFTQRKVVAFLSANHIEPDLAAELFILDEPVLESPPPSVPLEDLDRTETDNGASPQTADSE